MAYAGFCVGGVDWPRPELEGITDPRRRAERLRGIGRDEARMTSGLGGNVIRLFYAMRSVLAPADEDIALLFPGTLQSAVTTTPVEARVEMLDRAAAALEGCVDRLGLSDLDAYLAGVEDFNSGGPPVRVVLTLVSMPCRWIVEAPSADTLGAHGRTYTQASLWRDYVGVHVEVHRALARRYIGGRSPVVCAFEVGNEPDYCWIPAEMKIEGGPEGGAVWPLWKYVTELHLSQVPEREEPAAPFEAAPWGYRDQDADWPVTPPTPITRLHWGAKFDWYVKSFAELQAAIARALRGEADVDVVSAAVTHNNVDYLMRMRRAVPGAFDDVTKIGIHPYHWVDNDVWNDRFVDDAPTGGWREASPREYARAYFKRFDFLRELRDVADGRPLWITEFGIGSKVLGSFNAPVAEYTKFIRPRAEIGAAAGHDAAVWEDLWEAFLTQVGAAWLADNRVECLLVYALRESGVTGLDMDDEDRSNLALLHRDGTPRLEPDTLNRLAGLLGAVAGAGSPAPDAAASRPGSALHGRPWRAAYPGAPAGPMTMLSAEERKLLRWLTAEWCTGAGAIVDAGCFVGGSTVALAHGLADAGTRLPHARIDVFDRFEVEPYMADLYFSELGLEAGDSFRPLFDRNTKAFADLLHVHEGDLSELGWHGGAIELLFIDIAKSWQLNDLIVRDFFPHLIPDRSVVVQQDLVFALGHWLPITMEHLAEYFEPVSFVEYNTVVYVCRRPVPRDLAPASGLPAEQKLTLIERAIRRFRGYPRGYLELARCVLLAELGDEGAAAAELARVTDGYRDDPLVTAAAAIVP